MGPRGAIKDTIIVHIPLDVTADMGVVMRRTRTKRIAKLRKTHPEFFPDEEKKQEELSDDNNEEEEKDGVEDKEKKKKKETKPESVGSLPRRDQYGSVLDYLEAKYVRGVMLDEDDAQDGEEAEDDDGRGSVYSESSLIDDTLLKRHVAEQVVASAALPKMEMEESYDDGFFVNVGALEMEQDVDELMGQLDEIETKKPVSKKRPRSTSAEKTSKGEGGSATKKTEVKKKASQPGLTAEQKKEMETRKKAAATKKAESKKLQQRVIKLIQEQTEDVLPRKKKQLEATFAIPHGKKPGDVIKFSNPHIAGQRLSFKIPAGAAPGSEVKVAVPAPEVTGENKLPRELQMALEEFSQVYDEYCQAEGHHRELNPGEEKFVVHHERLKKFDTIIKSFPKDLATPIEASYLRMLVRRARQNLKKRAKTLAASVKETVPESTLTVHVPVKSTNFPTIMIDVPASTNK